MDFNGELKAMVVSSDDDLNEYRRVEADFSPNGKLTIFYCKDEDCFKFSLKRLLFLFFCYRVQL
jgi:hypothetical protein